LKDGEDAIVENEWSILAELDQWYNVHLSRKKRDQNGAFRQYLKEKDMTFKALAVKEALSIQGTGQELRRAAFEQ
jgi:hypothetical protein